MTTTEILRGYGICLLVGGWPILSILGAVLLGKLLGCKDPLNEAAKPDCIRWGIDFGEIMYAMGMMGWLLMFTLGLGLFAIIGWTIYWMSR